MFKHILIAVDGSAYSRQAVPVAIEFAKKFQGDIFVLHVRERELGRGTAFEIETSDEATQLVTEVVKTMIDAGVSASGETHGAFTGHAAKNIVETAKAKGADLIVLGSRGLSDLGGLLLGSVTHKVMQLAHTAVLVVRTSESATEIKKTPAGAKRAASA